MKTTTANKLTGLLGEEASGCWIDGHHGRYVGEEVQGYAENYGWQGTREAADEEHYESAWDEAENWLNDNVAGPDYYFGTAEGGGDWGLWPADLTEPKLTGKYDAS